MAWSKGRAEVRQYLRETVPPALLKVLRGAGRVAGNVIAKEAEEKSISDEVSDAIKVKVTVKDRRIVVWVHVTGPMTGPAGIAVWLEYGTASHQITIRKKTVLAIGGKIILGKAVDHPGAYPHPFLRPALELKISEAIAAAQAFIDARVRRSGIDTSDIAGDEA